MNGRAASLVGAVLVAASVGSTAAAPSGEPASVEPASGEPASLEVEGAWQHRSGMTFPERAAGFARVAVSAAPPRTHRVEYRLREGTETLVTVAASVYPHTGQALEERFADVVAALGVELGSAPRRREGTAVDQAAGMANGLAAHWSHSGELGGRRRELESRVLLFRRGEWFVEYRVRFAAAARGRVELELDDLLRSLAMPPG